MTVSRRQFLDYCKNAAAAVGLSTVQLGQLEKALANPERTLGDLAFRE